MEKNTRDIKAGIKVTLVGAVLNIVLVAIKIYAGLVGRSQALLADGIHSLSDLLSDIIVLLGLKWGSKQADEDHPFGHGRLETLSSMFVGVFLLLVGLGIVYKSVISIYNHETSSPDFLTLVVAAISIGTKEALYWYTIKVGKQIKSLALIGNAWHHRSDALSSVAVFVGIGIAYINPAWILADSIAALVVTFFIVKAAFSLIYSSIKEFVDTSPDQTVIDDIEKNALMVKGVIEAHDIKARFSAGQILTEIHIVVDPDLSVREGHSIAKAVEATLLNNIEDLQKVTIHVDPDKKQV